MNLHEYQAKQLFARYGLPAPVGYACTTPREAEEAASKIGANLFACVAAGLASLWGL
ncbi:ATP-grasp domain-containing protein, partial [Klebsiella pneumoniae]